MGCNSPHRNMLARLRKTKTIFRRFSPFIVPKKVYFKHPPHGRVSPSSENCWCQPWLLVEEVQYKAFARSISVADASKLLSKGSENTRGVYHS